MNLIPTIQAWPINARLSLVKEQFVLWRKPWKLWGVHHSFAVWDWSVASGTFRVFVSTRSRSEGSTYLVGGLLWGWIRSSTLVKYLVLYLTQRTTSQLTKRQATSAKRLS